MSLMDYVTSIMKKRHEQEKSVPNFHAAEEIVEEQLLHS